MLKFKKKMTKQIFRGFYTPQKIKVENLEKVICTSPYHGECDSKI